MSALMVSVIGIGVVAALIGLFLFLLDWWDARREAARKRKRASHA